MERKFAHVAGYESVPLPKRKTARSAGYDFVSAETITIGPGDMALVATGVKAYMDYDEVLMIYIRSSLAVKRGLRLANGAGVIDADYADNEENEGHIMIPLWNASNVEVTIESGERIAQGVFLDYWITDDDDAEGERVGGVGSTGR